MAQAEVISERNRTDNNKEEYENHQQNLSAIIEKDKPVCVIDASGLLGSALVKALLQRGYFVHVAALQSQGDQQNMKTHFVNENSKNVKIFHADLLDYHSILDSLSGCSALFYTFEPPVEHPIYNEHMVEIEVRAALNVLEACAQTPSMKKVIYTSSATAVIWNNTRKDSSSSSDEDVDEKCWSDMNFCKKYKLWHALSKTLAEKTAWALANDRGLNMVTVNGGLLLANNGVTGLPATTNDKHSTLSQLPPYLKGAAEMYEQGVLVTVDLRFLVDAHIYVFEEYSSYGRYLCFNHLINCHKDAVKLANMFISSPPHSDEDMRAFPQRISNKKLNKLIVNFDGQLQTSSEICKTQPKLYLV